MIQPFSGERAHVMFVGRRSFRMEARTLPGTNELAIPSNGSDIPTERISESDRLAAVLAAETAAPSAGVAPRVSTGAVIGLVSTTLVFGILLTATLNRSWSFQGTRLLARHSMEKAPEPAPAPPPQPLVQQIVVASAPIPFDAQPLRRPVSKPTRDGRVRGARALQSQRPTGATGSESPDPAPVASPRAVAKWVDPFAE